MSLQTANRAAVAGQPALASPSAELPDAALELLIERVCATLAPAWPLDRAVAVNPLWGMTDRALPRVATDVLALCGNRLLMPRSWYREQWQAGAISEEHLRAVIECSHAEVTVQQLLSSLETTPAAVERRSLVTDLHDGPSEDQPLLRCAEVVIENISQHCAAFFDRGQASLHPSPQEGLYASWRKQAQRDRRPALLLGLTGFADLAGELPDQPLELIASALDLLDVPPAERQRYLIALLLDINGWAAWCAHLRWTARLEQRDDENVVELLAIRLAWEWLLYRAGGESTARRWRRAMASWAAIDAAAAVALEHDWLLQDAIELAYQQRLCRQLIADRPAAKHRVSSRPALQAVFCIDVRSELLRRALEARSPTIQTIGAAGFFGLPLVFQPLASAASRPHLPALLAPTLQVSELAPPAIERTKSHRLAVESSWKKLKTSAASGFSYVEAFGALHLARLVSHSLGWTRPEPQHRDVALAPTEREHCRLSRLSHSDGSPVSPQERTELAAKLLRSISLTEGFGRLIALVGHGSQSVNNPHASGLDCGACAGQTGEISARAAAQLLNDPAVRQGLSQHGIALPADTHFVACLHDTTTDDVALLDVGDVPPTHRDDLKTVRGWFKAASACARHQRTRHMTAERPSTTRSIRRRANDWSEVRPEWGLANNAAFIAAPRSRTRELDLQGRAFLHDYRWRRDEGFATLEMILTAPVLVAHWINFQYYASTVAPQRFGSGNKVLHNVVGSTVGVFEGNGGDLRIGLPLQSVHNGERWVHTPLRLSVFVEAPRHAIAAVVAKHNKLRDLVQNGWIHLFCIEDDPEAIFVSRGRDWRLA